MMNDELKEPVCVSLRLLFPPFSIQHSSFIIYAYWYVETIARRCLSPHAGESAARAGFADASALHGDGGRGGG
jgi:hypothetical protein